MTTKIILPALFSFLVLYGMTELTSTKHETKYFNGALLHSQSQNAIRFSFTANKMSNFKGLVEIEATLHNDNIDTVYFLTSSCDGEQYSLQYDTSKYFLVPFKRCFSRKPLLLKILPSGLYRFKSHFKVKASDSKMKLGFDFFRVDRQVKMSKINLDMIYNRPDKGQYIIWSDDVLINDSATSRQQEHLRKPGLR